MRLNAIYLMLFLFCFTYSTGQIKGSYDRYIIASERCFDKQDFDSCLYYNYILAHNYTENNDTSAIINTWYNIGIVNFFQNKPTRAMAAPIIANHFFTRKAKVDPHLKIIYNCISLKTLPGSGTFAKCSSEHIRKLSYLPQLYKAVFNLRNNQFKIVKTSLQELIRNMTLATDTNWFGYAKANMLLGDCFYNTDDYLKSISYYECTIKVLGRLQEINLEWANSFRCLLNALYNTGQKEKWDSYIQRIEEPGFINKNRFAYYYIKGDVLRYNFPKEALEAYLQAYYSKDTIENINALNLKIFYYYTYLGQYEKAKDWLKKIDKNEMDDYDKVRTAYSCAKLGDTITGNDLIKNLEFKKQWYSKEIVYWLAKYYFAKKNYNKAENYQKLSIKYVLEAENNNLYDKMLNYTDLGYFYWYGRTDYKASLTYYHKAVFELVSSQESDDYYQLPDISQSINDKDLARELKNKGDAFFAVSKLQKNMDEMIRDLKASLANLELAMTVAHRYKMNLSSDEQRYLYADGIQHWYPFLTNICLELYRKTGQSIYSSKAFEYSEKSKSSLLLSTMRGINARNMSLLPGSVKDAEDHIWARTELISQYLSESYNAPGINQAKIDQYNAQLIKLRHRQDSLLKLLRQKYPSYYNIRYNDNVIKADSLQKLLRPNEAALEYTVSSKNIVIYLVTRNEFKVFTDTTGPGFFSDVEAYHKHLSDYTYDYRDSVIRNYALLANRLYNRLVKPAEPYIKGKKLLIIPDDVLTQIPFETLVTKPLPDNVQASFKILAYLVKEHVIYYNYSGTLYAMNRGSHLYPQAKLLAVAPEYKNKTSRKWVASDTSHSDSTILLPIPWASEEVKEIHKIFGGKILSKGSATEERFKEIAGKYNILHLAAHGLVNNNYPMFSKLVFTGGKDSINNGYLNTYEIYNMHINAPLVVLSACNTGSGQLHKGEGMISLARGFFTAGAKSIIMTLWAVSDKTSSLIVKNFYGNLSSQQNIGDAMQKSKIQYLEQTDEEGAHPYFWSGYIVLGNAGNSFEPIPPKHYYLLWASGSLILFMLWVMRKKIWLKFSTFWEYRRF